MGGFVVALSGGVDTVWALVTCYLVTALAWLLYRARGEQRVPAGEAAALAALGLLLLAVRITAVYPWLDVLPGALRVGCPDPGGGPDRTDRRAGRRERTRPGQPWNVMYPLPSRSLALAVYAWVSACAPEGL